jgi:hypothetical protein
MPWRSFKTKKKKPVAKPQGPVRGLVKGFTITKE